jgi:hypothetical protein
MATLQRRPLAQRRTAAPVQVATRQIAEAAEAATARIAEVAAVERKAVQPFQMVPVQPVGKRKINMMVYGPYGHGKTTFAATALDVPSMCDVLFINAEAGDMSLTGRRSLDLVNINKYDQLARIFEFLTLHCMWRDQGNIEKLLEAERALKSTVIDLDDQTPPTTPGRTWFEEQRLRIGKPMDEPFMYRTVIIDSISEAHKYLVYKFTGVDIGKTKLSEEIEKMEEWQPAQELFRLLIRSFRDLRMNTIFVAAENIVEPDRKKGRLRSQALPKLAGQMAGDIAGFIDIVGYLVREIGKDGDISRYLYLGAGYEDWISKHRFENLPDLEYVQEPTLSSLIDLARKDADSGTSFSHPVTARSSTSAPSARTRPAATNSRRAARSASGR